MTYIYQDRPRADRDQLADAERLLTAAERRQKAQRSYTLPAATRGALVAVQRYGDPDLAGRADVALDRDDRRRAASIDDEADAR